MKVLLIEDEAPAARRLNRLLLQVDPQIEVLNILDSVEDSVHWLKNNKQPELLFADIQLADGMSFEIFEQVEINCPVVFTTAFDHYAIKAFKVNSIDYLLKPLELDELERALDKFKTKAPQQADLLSLIQNMSKQSNQQFKERFLIKVGDQLKYVHIDQIAYFYFEEGYCHLVKVEGGELVVDYSLDYLNEHLNPKEFFRISRKIIVHHQSIDKIHNWFNGRLKVELSPSFKGESMVSRDRVVDFKMWLNE